MSDKEMRRAAEYILTALAVAAVLGATELLAQLQGGGEINWRPILIVALGSLVAAGRSAFIDRIGSKPKARTVKDLAAEVSTLSPLKRRQLQAEVEARNSDQPLPPTPRYPNLQEKTDDAALPPK